METIKKLTRVLNVFAVVIFVSAVCINVTYFIDLLRVFHATQNMLQRLDTAFDAWVMNFCLVFPWIVALSIITWKKGCNKWIWRTSFIYGSFFTGYYSITFIACCIAVDAYIRALLGVFVTINVVFVLFMLLVCINLLKDKYLKQPAEKSKA